MDSLWDRVAQSLDETFLLDTLQEMVSIDSILGNEAELADYVADKLQSMGISPEYDEVLPNRSNVYGTVEFENPGKTFTFNGHLDTVDIAEGWSFDPFEPTIQGEKLFGLGVADMKAGIACQLTVVKALMDYSDELKGILHITAVVDEEGYGSGARKMMKHQKYQYTDAIFIGEPFFGIETDPIPKGMTGKVLYNIKVNGKSAHAFRPHEGVNAVTDAARIVEVIDEINTTTSDKIQNFIIPRDNEFSDASFCVLKIDGGYKTYNVTVPDNCEIILNRLTLPNETKETVLADLTALMSELELESSVDIELWDPYYQAYRVNPEEDIMQSIETAYEKVFAKKPVMNYMQMISDANIFSGESNIPTINFGPKGSNLHGANESVDIDTLLPSSEVMALSFLSFQEL